MSVRLYHQVTPSISLTGRLLTAFASRHGDAAIGLEMGRRAAALIAERR